MKKRILALALAGTTAFSVFGGLNVFAVNYGDEAYEAYKPVILTIKDDETITIAGDGKGDLQNISASSSTSISYDGSSTKGPTNYKADLDKFKDLYNFASAIVMEDEEFVGVDATVESGKIYMYD